ncbi:MAG: YggT family protein [Atopostipes suicloacalis]|nr:YggT family protein [Atopostipes suicloacalis]MDN6730949.1 YggT family protein [Atopostipes suicloacalis]
MINIISQLANLLIRAIDLYRIILLAYFLMSWLPGAYQSKLGFAIYRIAEPYVRYFRRFVPPIGNISLAGIVALLALSLIRTGLIEVASMLINLLN